MKIRLGIDIACRSSHHAACADERGKIIWSGYRFRTDVADLESLWARLPVDVEEVITLAEGTRPLVHHHRGRNGGGRRRSGRALFGGGALTVP